MRHSLLLLTLLSSALVAQQPASPQLDRGALRSRISSARSTRLPESAILTESRETAARLESLEDRALAGSVPVPSPAEQAKDEATAARMTQAIRRLSDEGKVRLAQNTATPTAIQSVGGPVPQPIVPVPLTAPETKKVEHIIIHADSMIWDSAESIMVAVGNVDLTHPQFHLTCEELEVHMKKQPKKADEKDAKGKAKAAPAPVSAGPSSDASQLEKAIARGPKVVIEQMGEDGKMKTGQCRLLQFDGTTSTTVLRIWPQVSDGTNIQIGDEESTIMILSPEGRLTTKGRSHVDIVQPPAEKPKAPAAPAPPVPPAPGTAPASPTPQR